MGSVADDSYLTLFAGTEPTAFVQVAALGV